MPQSDLGLRLLSLAMAIALLVIVHGERRVTEAFLVPVEARLPRGLEPSPPLPETLRVSISGPWARLRAIDPADLGPLTIDLSRTGPGAGSWFVRPESLHVPNGVRVEALQPVQGSFQLRPETP